MKIHRLRSLFELTSFAAMPLAFVFWQGCSGDGGGQPASDAGAIEDDGGSDAAPPDGMTADDAGDAGDAGDSDAEPPKSKPVAVRAATRCTFIVTESGRVLFAGDAHDACGTAELSMSDLADVVYATPQEVDFTPQDVVDVKTAAYTKPLFLTKTGEVRQLATGTIATGVRSMAVGSFARVALIHDDDSVAALTTTVDAPAKPLPTLQGATSVIVPYGCYYGVCGLIAGSVECVNPPLPGCENSQSYYMPPTDLVDDVTAIESEYGNAGAYAIRAGGALWAFGTPSTVVVGMESGVTAVSASSLETACAVKNGEVWCWGQNDVGQLGDGTKENRAAPTRAVGLTDAVGVSVATDHTCAWKADGSVWCWGNNADGQLGDGTKTERLVPVQIEL